MQKLKKKNPNFSLNYSFFLQNINLKKKNNLKNILFQNNTLFSNEKLNSKLVEINNFKTILVNFQSANNIYTIKKLYENQLLFNYKLNYNIISYLQKILFLILIKKMIIKGRILTANNKFVYIYYLGYIYKMRAKKLHILCNHQKKINSYFYKINKRKNIYIYKRQKAKEMIKYYKLKLLNFDILIKKSFGKKKFLLSRLSYITKLSKKNSSKKLHVKKFF